jgi:uncharacterized protein (TIGR02598 family)
MKSSTLTSAFNRKAFSLVEVVVAVGVFAIAIVSVIGIIAGIGRSVSEVSDADKAARLVGVIQARLQASPFSVIAGSLKAASTVSSEGASYDPSTDTRVFFASEDGAIVAPYADTATWGQNGTLTTPAARDALKYFELTLIRNETLSPAGNDNTAGFLAFNIRVRWPAYLPNGVRVTDHTQKEVLIIPAAITR